MLPAKRNLLRLGPLVAGLLLAAALRVYHLDRMPLWWDEGLSLFFARLDYGANARMAVLLADTNPPLYRLLLGVWLNTLGWSPFTARLLSAWAGVLLVATLYPLARAFRLPHRAAALVLALGAASPMFIYYAQEAKGYSLVTLASTVAIWLWLRLHRSAPHAPSSRWRAWLAWTAMVLFALGAHYITLFLLVALNFWTLRLTVSDWRNWRAWRGHWAWQLGTQMAAAAVLIPFVVLTYGGTSAAVRGETGAFSGLNGPAEFFGRHLLEFTQGPTATGNLIWETAVLFSIIAGYGFLRRRDGRLLAWIAIPLVLGALLNAYHEFFFPRFLLYVVPALLILVAAGLDGLGRARWLASLILLGLWAVTLNGYFNRAWDPTEDWRPAARELGPRLREGDAAVYVWGWIPGYLDAYLPRSPRPAYTLGYLTPATVDAQMTSLAQGQNRIWLLDNQVDALDERNLAGRWLGAHGALIYDNWFGHAHLALVTLLPTPTAAYPPVTREFANGLVLSSPALAFSMNAGEALTVQLTWTARQAVPERATVYLHGLAADGTLAFGRDSEPRNGLAFFSDLLPGQTLTELRGVLLPPDLAPGTYTIEIGLYDTLTQQPIGPAALTAGTLQVP